MTEPQLKPCPFCGSEAELKASHGGLFRSKDGDKPTRIYWIECINECHVAQHFPEDVIDIWNKRTQAKFVGNDYFKEFKDDGE